MHLLSVLFDRVYINISSSYNEYFLNINLQRLLDEVAIVNPDGDAECDSDILYCHTEGKVYTGRTKKYVVKKVNAFIAGLQEEECLDDNMATFASKKQLENLIYASYSSKRKISCYSIIYFYIIFTLLYGKSQMADKCAEYVKALAKIIFSYFEDNKDDQLAAFCYECVSPIYNAIINHNCFLQCTALPSRPRKHPHQDFE